jgi:hypothetical protein
VRTGALDLLRLDELHPFFHADRISTADLTIYGMPASLSCDTILGVAACLASRPRLSEFKRRVEAATGE